MAAASRRRLLSLPTLLLPLLCLLSACATRGPLHVYTIPPRTPAENIHDHSEASTAEVPSFLKSDETLLGFAYDPFTDHFFLRLAPGKKIRVVDRPARAIKREFTIDALSTGGDLAVLPRSGHIFFLTFLPTMVVETSRLGEPVNAFALEGVPRASGLAVDPTQNQLIALHGDGRQISFHDLRGKHLRTIPLAQSATGSLAFDAERRELYASLRDSAEAVGVFDTDGKLLRRLPLAAQFLDVGPRSLVRVF